LTPIVYKLRCAGLVRAPGRRGFANQQQRANSKTVKGAIKPLAFLQSKPALAMARDADVPIPLFLEIIFTNLPEMVIPAILCRVKHFSSKKRKKPESLELPAVFSCHAYLERFIRLTRAGGLKLAPGLPCHNS
jgi:hypothetical protein